MCDAQTTPRFISSSLLTLLFLLVHSRCTARAASLCSGVASLLHLALASRFHLFFFGSAFVCRPSGFAQRLRLGDFAASGPFEVDDWPRGSVGVLLCVLLRDGGTARHCHRSRVLWPGVRSQLAPLPLRASSPIDATSQPTKKTFPFPTLLLKKECVLTIKYRTLLLIHN